MVALAPCLYGSGMAYEPLPGYAVRPEGRFKHVMALALNPLTGFEDGVIRCITRREGRVDVSGFIDRSELHLVRKAGLHEYEIEEALPIAEASEGIARIQPDGYEFIGFEDPDLYADEKGTLHLYFTIPLICRAEALNLIYLGHAEGPDLHSLRMTEPALMSAECSAKEVTLMPRSADGRVPAPHRIQRSRHGAFGVFDRPRRESIFLRRALGVRRDCLPSGNGAHSMDRRPCLAGARAAAIVRFGRRRGGRRLPERPGARPRSGESRWYSAPFPSVSAYTITSAARCAGCRRCRSSRMRKRRPSPSRASSFARTTRKVSCTRMSTIPSCAHTAYRRRA